MITIYLSAAVIVVASLSLGEALVAYSGLGRGIGFGPVVGLATLICVASAASRIASGLTAACTVVVVLVLVGLVLRQHVRVALARFAAPAVAFLVASVPFIMNGRTGILGVSLDDDFAAHLVWADALRRGAPLAPLIFPDYPIGPHALVADVAALLGTDVEGPFMGLMLALPALIAASAWSGLEGAGRVPRLVGSVLVGIPFLVAAYFGQGNFKELITALIIVGVALGLRGLSTNIGWRGRCGLPFGLVLAGALLTSGRSGVVWPLGVIGMWFAAELLRLRRPPWPGPARPAVAAIGLAVVVTVVAVSPSITRLLHFTPNLGGGNVPGNVPVGEIFGLWLHRDYRLPSTTPIPSGLLEAFALALAAYAVSWWWRRRDVAIPAGVAAWALTYLVVRASTAPYITGKALIVGAPVLMLLIVAPLLVHQPARRALPASILGLAGVGFLAVATWSSGLALSGVPVGPDWGASELAPVRRITRNQPTVYLLQDNFAFWKLRGAKLSVVAPYAIPSQIPFRYNAAKPVAPGAATDFDTVEPADLDRFRYAVTSRSAYASEPPPNWRQIRTTPHYALWERRARTDRRQVLSEGSAPGAVLDCRSRAGRRITRSSGVARIRLPPIVGSAAAWASPAGGTAAVDALGFAAVQLGKAVHQTLHLSGGHWEMSLPYQSPADLTVTAPGLRATLPADLDARGPYWRAGTVQVGRRAVTISVRPSTRAISAGREFALIGPVAATPLGQPSVTRSLSDACARYVDWYRASSRR